MIPCVYSFVILIITYEKSMTIMGQGTIILYEGPSLHFLDLSSSVECVKFLNSGPPSGPVPMEQWNHGTLILDIHRFS